MYHQPMNQLTAFPISRREAVGSREPSDMAVRLLSVLIICTLPLIAIWLLFRLALEQLQAAGREVRLFYTDVAEELGRG